MNRVFITLYLLIVSSVIFLGWGADRIWQIVGSESEGPVSEVYLYELIESDLAWQETQDLNNLQNYFSQRLSLPIKIFSLQDFAQSSFSQELGKGEIVTIYDEDGVRTSFKRISRTDYVLRIAQSDQRKSDQALYFALLFGFYCAVAIVIYLWVWPLSRDLKILQRYTKKVGDENLETVQLAPSSAVHDLAEAFNLMAARINDLLASHREMTYAVSHELRTPLARMKFALEILADNKGDLPKSHIEGLKNDVAEMDTLINELLTYAGFEQKNQTLEFKSGDLSALISELAALNKNTAASKHIDIEVVSDLISPKVRCEWYLMERCIHNLLQNAVKYAKSKIMVRVWDDKAQYFVSVEDDGPGVSKPDRKKIFQAFVRIRNANEENKSGFGLGLAIVHRIVKWHNGGVEVSDSSLGGAKFTLSWPKK